MKENELTIEIPENHEIDWQESAKQEKIVFKKKDSKPRSWKEYCEQQRINNKPGYYFNGETCRIQGTSWREYYTQNEWKNVLPSEELAEAFLAMMQLMSLRQAWIGDWKPDWKTSMEKWCVLSHEDEMEVHYHYYDSCPLSFPTQEMAEEFLNCFKDLLEIAKPLI